MVKRLKQNRQDCATAIAKDLEEIRGIDLEISMINERYVPLSHSLEQKIEESQKIAKQIEESSAILVGVSLFFPLFHILELIYNCRKYIFFKNIKINIL